MDDGAAVGAVSVRNRQLARRLSDGVLDRLARCGAACLRLVAERYLERVKIPEAVSVVLLDDAEMARVHGEFMDDPSPTDVITFPYGVEGEVLIGVETAARQALVYGVEFEREMALYVVHGLLHLCGYEDATAVGREEMQALQEELLAASLEGA